jgi:Pan3 Pseudokinase domain
VISCLNKLDVGDSEKILLTSRDKRSILIASYEDVKRCLDGVSSTTKLCYCIMNSVSSLFRASVCTHTCACCCAL